MLRLHLALHAIQLPVALPPCVAVCSLEAAASQLLGIDAGYEHASKQAPTRLAFFSELLPTLCMLPLLTYPYP